MDSTAYIYSLFDNKGIVRRDFPQSSPIRNIAIPDDSFEVYALATRARMSTRNQELLKSIKPPQPQKPKLVSSADGKITKMLLTIPVITSNNEKKDLTAIYTKLFETLPITTELTCLVNFSSKADVESWIEKHGRKNVTIIESPDHVAFSIWAQDAYVIVETSTNDTYFIEPLSFLRYADALIADYITTGTTFKNFQTPLYFQGGNILVGDNFWLIGVDYPNKTLSYIESSVIRPKPDESEDTLVQRLFSEYLDTSRKLNYVGSTVPVPSEQILLVEEQGRYFVDHVFQGNKSGTAQPLFHIDMFLSLAGRNENNQYQVLVGDPSLAPTPPSIPSTNFGAYTMQKVYDNIAKNLAMNGFQVIRNALPLTFNSKTVSIEKLNKPENKDLFAIYTKLDKAGLSEVEIRSWYFATANNALVQNDPSDKRVWLPTYGHGEDYAYLKASDNSNKEVWESLGFSVVMLPSFHSLARGLGAVHCIQKYLGRS